MDARCKQRAMTRGGVGGDSLTWLARYACSATRLSPRFFCEASETARATKARRERARKRLLRTSEAKCVASSLPSARLCLAQQPCVIGDVEIGVARLLRERLCFFVDFAVC